MRRVYAHLSVCTDCLNYLANGSEDAAYSDAMKRHIERELDGIKGELVPGSEDLGFSWSPCELCRSCLGGDRHDAILLAELIEKENNDNA